ncbi:MAG: chromate resistance protein ChrB domain-containing protein [Burkholderiaceae bacterium]
MRVDIISNSWLLLIVTLPTQAATVRMRVWRALKAGGCAPLRDGAYMLPAGADRQVLLRGLGVECERVGGGAWLMHVQSVNEDEASAYRQLFDRRDEYDEQRQAWKDAAKELSSQALPDVAKTHKRLQREFEALKAIDFFPSEASAKADAAWIEFSERVDAVLSPDEPRETSGDIPRLEASSYQGRVWATRRSLWVDRVASAWLIQRFIDKQARFQWLATISDCPRTALGFDFDGATFTHVGERVTFETLMATFGLDGDAALKRLAAMVHGLDVGGDQAPEAGGFEAVLAGARERLPDDDALLAEMSAVLDSLYAHFSQDAAGKARKASGRSQVAA